MKYKSIEPKKRGAFMEKHAGEIEQYESAAAYVKDHLNGRDKIPEKAWRDERETLLAERFSHVDEYYGLRDDVRSVEMLRSSAERLMGDITPERNPVRKRDVEL